MIKMVVVLTILSVVSGGGLKGIRSIPNQNRKAGSWNWSKDRLYEASCKGASNDPVESRFKIQDGEEERTVFVGAFDGKPKKWP
jgi:Na+-translocating ferredoxin:NAD+ oxidoreductase subunit G